MNEEKSIKDKISKVIEINLIEEIYPTLMSIAYDDIRFASFEINRYKKFWSLFYKKEEDINEVNNYIFKQRKTQHLKHFKHYKKEQKEKIYKEINDIEKKQTLLNYKLEKAFRVSCPKKIPQEHWVSLIEEIYRLDKKQLKNIDYFIQHKYQLLLNGLIHKKDTTYFYHIKSKAILYKIGLSFLWHRINRTFLILEQLDKKIDSLFYQFSDLTVKYKNIIKNHFINMDKKEKFDYHQNIIDRVIELENHIIKYGDSPIEIAKKKDKLNNDYFMYRSAIRGWALLMFKREEQPFFINQTIKSIKETEYSCLEITPFDDSPHLITTEEQEYQEQI